MWQCVHLNNFFIFLSVQKKISINCLWLAKKEDDGTFVIFGHQIGVYRVTATYIVVDWFIITFCERTFLVQSKFST